MHNICSICLATCLSIQTATAFYPYIPKYGDDDSSSTSKTRRSPSPSISNPPIRRAGFTLPLHRVPKPIRRDNNYNIVESSDPTQKNSVAIDQDGDDKSYMVAVTIGDSKEEYHLLLDSAASNTWVMSEECKADACGTHNTFGTSDSSSLKTDATTFSITYGTGSVSGTEGTDTVHIGSLSPSLTFGLATNVSSEFSSYPMDGILGIGRGDTTSGLTSFLDALSSVDIPKLFGVHLSRSSDGTKDGELDFGAPNSDRYADDLNYIKTIDNTDGFWEISVDDAGAVDADADSSSASLSGRSAILDTGTSYILMPPSDAEALHALIPNSQHSGETFTVPCSITQVLFIELGGVKYHISTADYIGDATSADKTMCASNIVGRQTFGDTQWLVGDVFLKNVYAVFDLDNNQVGLGVKSDGTELGGSSRSATGTATGTGTAAKTGAAATATGTGSGSQATGTAAPTAQGQSSQGAATGAAVPQSVSMSGSWMIPVLGLLSGFV